MFGVAEKRGRGRGPVGVECDFILSRCLKIEPEFILVNAARLKKPYMQKAALVGFLLWLLADTSWWALDVVLARLAALLDRRLQPDAAAVGRIRGDLGQLPGATWTVACLT